MEEEDKSALDPSENTQIKCSNSLVINTNGTDGISSETESRNDGHFNDLLDKDCDSATNDTDTLKIETNLNSSDLAIGFVDDDEAEDEVDGIGEDGAASSDCLLVNSNGKPEEHG